MSGFGLALLDNMPPRTFACHDSKNLSGFLTCAKDATESRLDSMDLNLQHVFICSLFRVGSGLFPRAARLSAGGFWGRQGVGCVVANRNTDHDAPHLFP